MPTAYQMLQKMRTVNLTDMAGDIIDANKEQVVELNKKQLLKGLNSKGEQLGPKYSQDPYFKTPESARKYADWKKRLFPDMTYDVPNLIITGVYHRSISASRIGGSVRFEASASFANSIAGKYNNTALGLNQDSKNEAWVEIIKPPLVQQVAAKIGAKTSRA